MISASRLAALVAALLVSVAPAWAQADKRNQAEMYFRAGEQAYKAGQYLVAAKAFEESYALVPLPAIAFSTAQAMRLQYFIDKNPALLLRAIELYRLYIEQVSAGGRRDDASTNLAELETIRLRLQAEDKMGAVTQPVSRPVTQLMVVTQAAGARARIDGGDDGEVPLIRDVEPGPHRVEVMADGYFTETLQAVAVDGKFIVVEVPLKPQPAQVVVVAEGGAAVHVDGRPMGMTPLARPLELEAGRHFVAVTRRGRRPWSKEIEISRGERIELRPMLDTTAQRRASYWVLGAAGLALGGAATYTVLAISADRDLADLEDRRTTQGLTEAEFERYVGVRDDRDARARMAYAFWGVTGALAVTGGLMVFLDNPRADAPPEPSLSVAPALMRGGGALTVAGSF